ncbi:MAG: hypothetical protein KAQ83_01180 [Nanoarchaeota archaeon]|nr:hypothetical protein [Nanoarchaeota archaeon]
MALTESTEISLELSHKTINKGKQAIIFANTRRSAEKTAEELAKTIKESNIELEELEYEILHALSSPTKQCKRLAYCVKKGIAFHHSGLAPKQRELIEDAYREGKVKVIAATPTLAYGLDLPAFSVILQNLRRYSSQGLRYIPVLEYLQMSGRAGRPKFDNYGESIAIATSEKQKDELTEIYLKGVPEDIYSKLAAEPALRTYTLSLIATGFAGTKDELLKFFSKTFWAHHYGDMSQINVIVSKVLDMLEEYGFLILKGNSDFISIGDDIKIKPTPLGKRVAELYLDPLTADKIITGLKKADKNTKTLAFLQLISNTLELRPLLRAKKSDEELLDLTLNEYDGELLQDYVDYEYTGERQEYLNSLKTALFLFHWVNESNEENLLEKFDVRPGEISVKLKTADWLIYASVELAKVLGLTDIFSELMKLKVRINYGVKGELLALLKLKNIGKVRARKLFSNNIKDIGAVKRANFDILAQLIGNNITVNIKKQVGQDFSKMKVKKSKRTGQTSILKY